MFKHLMVILDGQSVENSLHLTASARDERLIAFATGTDLQDEALAREARDAVVALATESETPLSSQDAASALNDLLSDNDYDVHYDDLSDPRDTTRTSEVTPS